MPQESFPPQDRRGWFARGMQDSNKLRQPIQLAMTLSFLVVLVAVGLPLIFLTGDQLGTIWGIDPTTPLRGQQHELPWLLSFFVGFVCIMLVVAVIWNVFAIPFLVLIRGCSIREAYTILALCRYPTDWFKAEELDNHASRYDT